MERYTNMKALFIHGTSLAVKLSLALIAFTASSHAALVINDNFDYGGSDLTDGYGGWQDGTSQAGYEAGVTATWSGGDTDYVLNGAGGSFRTFMWSSSVNSRGAQLDTAALSGTFWTSVLIRESIPAVSDSGAIVAYRNSAYPGAFSWGNTDAYGVSGNGNLVTPTEYVTGGLTEAAGPIALPTGWGLYIAKVTVGAGNDSINLWAFDTADSFGTTEASLGVATYSSSTVDYGDTVSGFWLGYTANAAGATSDVNFDNLRVSNLSGDNGLQEVLAGSVIPEPGTLGLMLSALAGFAFLRMRRRK